MAPAAVMTELVRSVLPAFDSASVTSRQGAMECVAAVLERMETDVVPYISLLVVPVLGLISDHDADTRLLGRRRHSRDPGNAARS